MMASPDESSADRRAGNGASAPQSSAETVPLPGDALIVLPVRNFVLFPGTVMPLNVGRPKSKALLDEVMPGSKMVGVVTQ